MRVPPLPELPEVETTVRGLRPVLEGRTIAEVEVRRERLRFPFPPDLRQRLTGARVTGLGRRAKYGLVHTDRGTLVFHLGMTGKWRVDPAADDKHDHFMLRTDEGRRLFLNDHRRFGSVDMVDDDALPTYAPLAALGPEPLGPDLTAAHLRRALAGRTGGIKTLLLDQRIVAGLGNIYVCEALHRSGIAPGRMGGGIAEGRLERLVVAVRKVLEESIAAGGTTLRDFQHPDGDLGYFANSFRVYGREGERCGCGATVKRRVEGGRSTFYCGRCQR